MSDQADQLRRLVRETVQQDRTLKPGPPLVVVNGSQKGVGATTIAFQLAKELATQGKRTVLVDANPASPMDATVLASPEMGICDDAKEWSSSVSDIAHPKAPHPKSPCIRKGLASGRFSMEALRRAGSESRGTLDDVLAGDRTVLEALQPMGAGVKILPACWDPEAPPD